MPVARSSPVVDHGQDVDAPIGNQVGEVVRESPDPDPSDVEVGRDARDRSTGLWPPGDGLDGRIDGS